MGYENVLVEIDAPIATVTLHRPKVLNALSPDLIRALTAALADLDADETVRAVVLTGGSEVLAPSCHIGHMAATGAAQPATEQQTGRWLPLGGFSNAPISS